MSPQRSLNRTFASRIIVALSAPAFALAVVTASGGLSGSAAAQPASSAHVISAVTTARVLDTAAIDVARKAKRLDHTRQIAWNMLHRMGWRSRDQFRYLNHLWDRESSWNKYATNPYSGAYGIPQAVPGGKMASAGRNWRTSARTQIRWGLRYIRGRYGSPAAAWRHEIDYGWY